MQTSRNVSASNSAFGRRAARLNTKLCRASATECGVRENFRRHKYAKHAFSRPTGSPRRVSTENSTTSRGGHHNHNKKSWCNCAKRSHGPGSLSRSARVAWGPQWSHASNYIVLSPCAPRTAASSSPCSQPHWEKLSSPTNGASSTASATCAPAV